MSFTPRTTAPSSSDKHWIQVGSGGYNKCIYVNSPSVMPNCTGYAWGRFMEVMGATTCNLSTGDAGTWFNNKSDGYARGTTPKLGAVICWSKPGAAGHVAIVEKINSDGSIVVSESGYRHKNYFWTNNIGPTYQYSSSGYVFQGFIYNPSVEGGGSTNTVSRLTQFLQVAQSHVGEGLKGSWNYLNLDIEWCAAFVMSCAHAVEVLDVIIPNSYGCGTLATYGLSGKLGSRLIKGPRFGGVEKPMPGDIILFSRGSSQTDMYHTGIVAQVTNTTVHTIEGNTVTYNRYTSKVANKEYSINAEKIGGYLRPNWAAVGAGLDNLGLSGLGVGGYVSLYSSKNTREDAIIREVGYIKDGKPSISTSDIKLSVINYTDLLASFFAGFASSMGYGCDVIIDGIENPSAKVAIQFLMGKGLNAAAACGVCGNIEHESVPAYNTASVGDHGTSFGICQWHNERGTAMKKMAGDDWANDLTGQLEYLWYELNSSYYSHVLRHLQSVPDSEEGAKSAADYFVRHFEVPADIPGQTIVRQASAAKLFKALVVQQVSNSTAVMSGDLVTQSGIPVGQGSVVTIPSWVNQSGITGNYTNYSYFYSRWARSSVQRKLADIWGAQGKKSSRGIAVISNYYLMACTLTFGTTGDVVTVVLDDGTSINCIIADSKGYNPGATGESGNKYGHAFGNGTIDVIEWERVGSTSSSSQVSSIDLTGWKGKKVAKIINRGPYLR